jgi:DNA-binding transcriptional LysR family regulator
MEAAAVPMSVVVTMIEPLLELTKRGRGIAYLPNFAIHRYIESGEMIEVLPGQLKTSGTLNVLWPASRYPLPKVRVFVDFAATRLAKELCDLRLKSP